MGSRRSPPAPVSLYGMKDCGCGIGGVASGRIIPRRNGKPSWPASVRYYPLFCKADGSGYEILGRGVQFEIKAGQSLPDGVTPPDFYVPGEGLMTWRNVVTDGGAYDLNPTAGVVTFRVCSVRAAEFAGDTGSGGGCNAAAGAGFAPLALLLVAPLCVFVRSKGSIRR